MNRNAIEFGLALIMISVLLTPIVAAAAFMLSVVALLK